jgi:hypothetical protein
MEPRWGHNVPVLGSLSWHSNMVFFKVCAIGKVS